MGFRFQKRISFPGGRVNFSKGGVSLSGGLRGAWLTIGKRGVRTTFGLPGTGLSWTGQTPWNKAGPMPTGTPRHITRPAIICGIILVLWLIGALIGH
jgi:hypothetical protein